MRAAGLVTLIALSLAACVAADKGAEEELDLVDSADGKDDSLRRPTEHGDLAFDVAAHSALTEAERHHAWTFTLHGDADVTMTTAYSLLGQRRTDTVLYLYRETAAGWGAYIARNDDYGSTTYSQLVRHLGAGRYRMIVKGHLATTRGKFKLTAACRGDGCTAPVAPSGATITIVNIDNGLSTTCTNTLGSPVPPNIAIVIQTDTYIGIADLVDAPIPVRISW